MPILATRRSLLKLGFLFVATPVLARPDKQPIGVVELFTSQGCSSCPPADALFAELAERADLITLAYHVDYWDYLGWKDRLSIPDNTARQRAYGEVFQSSVYTPQAIVNGRENIVASDRSKLIEAINRSSTKLSTEVALSYSPNSIVIEIGAAPTPAVEAHVILVSYTPRELVEIRGGENKGRTVDYRNIVTNFQTLGLWQGTPMRLVMPKSAIARMGGNCAVLVQEVDQAGRPGPILGAAAYTAG